MDERNEIRRRLNEGLGEARWQQLRCVARSACDAGTPAMWDDQAQGRLVAAESGAWLDGDGVVARASCGQTATDEPG